MGRNQKVITKEFCQHLYIRSASNCDLVTVIEAISGGGKAIPPMIILQGKIYQECWYNCTTVADNTFLVVWNSGFSNNQLNPNWI